MRLLHVFLIGITLGCGLCSCSDSIDKRDIYTFTDTNIMQYFRQTPRFSLFCKILDRACISDKAQSSVASLLQTRGNYTVFAPDNDAVTLYFDSLYGKDNYSLDTLSQDVAGRIARLCVMDFGNEEAFMLKDLYDGTLKEGTIDGHFIIVRWGDFGDNTYIRLNGKARILHGDIACYNGYVHVIDRVLTASQTTLPGLIAETDNLMIFNHLLEITAWCDSMVRYKDLSYVPVEPSGLVPPQKYRLYGYTAFTETDSVFHRDWGVPLPQKAEDGHITNWEDIMKVINEKCRQAYPEAQDSDPTSPDNAVNSFVAYHLLDIKQPYKYLVHHGCEPAFNPYTLEYGTDSWMYYRTMGSKRLIKLTVTPQDKTIHLNRHCLYDNSFNGDYHETACDNPGITVREHNGRFDDNYAVNGYFWPIEHILLYTDYTRDVVLNERIRYDAVQVLPEFINADMFRWDTPSSLRISFGVRGDYCQNLKTNSEEITYQMDQYNNPLLSKFYFNLLQFVNTSSTPEFTIRLLPVPYSGNWEIRMFLSSYDYPTTVRIWMGDSPLPHLMKYLKTLTLKKENHIYNPNTYHPTPGIYSGGFIFDEYFQGDSLMCLENDKLMKAHGIMKGPKYHRLETKTGFNKNINTTMRNRGDCLRYIVYRGYLDAHKEHWIRMQALVYDIDRFSALNLDGFELVPEGIYNNPQKAEDVW